jgi:hypothetical protein
MKDYIGAVKVLGVVGDINFLDYGGTLIVENQGSIDGWHFEPNSEDESIVYLNQFTIESFKMVGDVDTQKDYCVLAGYTNDWVGNPSGREEWWVEELEDACKSYGVTVAEFYDCLLSDNPLKRAHAYDVIGSYHGYHELSGGDERTERTAEWRKRLALPCYRARKRGITVYT